MSANLFTGNPTTLPKQPRLLLPPPLASRRTKHPTIKTKASSNQHGINSLTSTTTWSQTSQKRRRRTTKNHPRKHRVQDDVKILVSLSVLSNSPLLPISIHSDGERAKDGCIFSILVLQEAFGGEVFEYSASADHSRLHVIDACRGILVMRISVEEGLLRNNSTLILQDYVCAASVVPLT